MRAKRATFTFWVENSWLKKIPKMVNLASFWKTEACGQTVLPDMSVLIRQKLAENAKIQKFQMRHFEWFSNNMLVLVKNVLELDWVYELLYKRLSYLTITNTYWFFAYRGRFTPDLTFSNPLYFFFSKRGSSWVPSSSRGFRNAYRSRLVQLSLSR